MNAALGLTAALTFNPSTSTPTPTPPPDASRLPVVGASAASAVVNARKVVEPAKAGTPPSSLVVSGPIPPALAHLWRSLSDSTTSMVDVWNSIGAVIASLEDSHGGQVPHSAGSSARTATGAEEVEKDLLDDVLWGEMVTELRKELKCCQFTLLAADISISFVPADLRHRMHTGRLLPTTRSGAGRRVSTFQVV